MPYFTPLLKRCRNLSCTPLPFPYARILFPPNARLVEAFLALVSLPQPRRSLGPCFGHVICAWNGSLSSSPLAETWPRADEVYTAMMRSVHRESENQGQLGEVWGGRGRGRDPASPGRSSARPAPGDRPDLDLRGSCGVTGQKTRGVDHGTQRRSRVPKPSPRLTTRSCASLTRMGTGTWTAPACDMVAAAKASRSSPRPPWPRSTAAARTGQSTSHSSSTSEVRQRARSYCSIPSRAWRPMA